MTTSDRLARRMLEARERTLALVEPLTEEQPRQGFAYDKERPRHEVEIDPLRIGADGWISTTFGRQAAIDALSPVIHVDFDQASSYRDAGLELLEWWTDAEGLYALSLSRKL